MADATESGNTQAADERKARKQAKRREKADKLQASADKKVALAAAASIAQAEKKQSISSSYKANRPHDTSEVQLSKALAYLLRHGALKEKLPIRADGYVALEALLTRPRLQSICMRPNQGSVSKPTAEDIRVAVRDNAKKRFEIATIEGVEYVRAVQGHSLEEVKDLDLVPLTLEDLNSRSSSSQTLANLAASLQQLDVAASAQDSSGIEVLHGTTREAWQLILSSGGLSRMKRNHIHLAAGRPGSVGVISGMRASSPIMLHIDIRQALSASIPFFKASNGAILTPGEGTTGILPLRFVSHVEDRTAGIIWRREEAQSSQ